MARARKFERLIEFWTTPQQADAFELLAANGLLTKSDLYRAAFDGFLRQQAALLTRPQSNGQHHQPSS